MIGPDLSIFEDKTWWVPYHLPPTEGNVIHAGGALLAASGVSLKAPVPLVLIFDEEQDAADYLDSYIRVAGGDGPDMTGSTMSFVPTWQGYKPVGLQPAKVANVLIDSGHVPIVVHHAWFTNIMMKLRNQGITASTHLAVTRHSQLAQRLHGSR